MHLKKKIIGKFDKKPNFWFIVSSELKEDFFIASRNSLNAWDWDIVEAVEVKNKKWKSREAKILKILEKAKVQEKKYENTIEWIFSQWKWEFWFIDVEWIDKWYFVFWDNKNWALDWDKVEAFVKVFKWKQEAEIIKIIERKKDLIVWKYLEWKNNNYWFVSSNNPNIKNDIFIPWKFSLWAKNWDIVWVLIKNWEGKNPEWEIKEIIWKLWDKKIDVLSLIVEWWAKLKFDEKTINFSEKIDDKITKEDEKLRKNLVNLFTFTIDWEDAKDLDDAISIEKLDIWWYKLYVHIADVAHYVKEWNPIDKEAYKRATSTYLVDRVIPMLPEKLSNNLCSLNPNTKKLTLTCEMTIWNNWKIKSTKVYESIISSDFRLTYKEVDQILSEELKENDKLLFWNIVDEHLIEKLKISNELKEKITFYREWSWVLNFDFPETKIILNDDDNVVEIKEYPRYNSNKLIEEFMISANEAVSSEFSNFPFLYRIHEEPKQDDLLKLQDTLNLFWIDFFFKKWTTKEFSELLDKISKLDESKKMFLEKIVLRTLTKAVYSKENFWHFGLWLSFYSHFTSPIRRYPDLQIHRIIKEKINKKLDKKRLFHYESILEKVSKHCSDKERKAEKLEYKIRDYYIVKYYKDKVWEEFEWVITWVLPKWFFVALKDSAEWFVEMTRSDFREELQEHLDLSSWKSFKLWTKVNVKLIEADEKLLRLNFEII